MAKPHLTESDLVFAPFPVHYATGRVHPNFKDLTDQRFERLSVIGHAGHGHWWCRCLCGRIAKVTTGSLNSGNSKSCGCRTTEASQAKRKNLVGRRFGRLVVIRYAGSWVEGGTQRCFWECRCECGNTLNVPSGRLRSDNTKSCGCLKRDRTAEVCTTHGHTRNYVFSPEYQAWRHIKTRCENSANRAFKTYGGATPPILVCRRWSESFEAFLADMGKRPPDK